MNSIKKIILIGVLLTTTISFGQRPDYKKIKSLKIAFITERLDLSSQEAEAFWPVYNAHEEQMNSFRKTERLEIRSKLNSIEIISDEEAEELLSRWMELEEKKKEEQKNFISKLSKIISARKTLLLQKTEEDFKKRLIKQYRKRNGGGMR